MKNEPDDTARTAALFSRDLSKLKQFADVVSTVSGLLTPALAIGMLITACYCLTTGVIPRGLTFGDTAAGIVVTLAFGLFYLLTIAYCTVSLIWGVALVCGVRRIWHTLSNKWRLGHLTQGADSVNRSLPRLRHVAQPWSIILGSFLLFAIIALVFMVLATNGASGARRLFMLLIVFAMSGFALAAAIFVESGNKSAPSRRSIAALVVLFLAPAIALPEVVVEVTMGIAGIRQSRKAVIVSNENLSKLQIAASSVGASLKICTLQVSSQSIVFDLDLQWHGIGDTTYARLLVDDGDWNRSPRFVTTELHSEGVSPTASNDSALSNTESSMPSLMGRYSAASVTSMDSRPGRPGR